MVVSLLPYKQKREVFISLDKFHTTGRKAIGVPGMDSNELSFARGLQGWLNIYENCQYFGFIFMNIANIAT